MVLDPADAPGERDADRHRDGHGAAGAVAHLGDVRGDLLESGVGERVELHLGHGPEARHAQPHAEADDPRLREGGVEAAVVAIGRGQAVGDPEDAAGHPHVLAEDEHVRVGGDGVRERPVERGGKGDGAHRTSSVDGSWAACESDSDAASASASSSACSIARCSRSCGVRVA